MDLKLTEVDLNQFQNLKKYLNQLNLNFGSGISSTPDVMVIMPSPSGQSLVFENRIPI
jgi:hypothetical protein